MGLAPGPLCVCVCVFVCAPVAFRFDFHMPQSRKESGGWGDTRGVSKDVDSLCTRIVVITHPLAPLHPDGYQVLALFGLGACGWLAYMQELCTIP